MIFVERPPCPGALDLSDPLSAASAELTASIDHWNRHRTAPSVKSFTAYARDDVRSALIALFKNKCAYCESFITGSSQSDIEHYRPKGGVSDADRAGVAHPGYWWLAMRWDNLVLSCMHCNQARRQLILEAGLDEEEIRKRIEKNDLRTTGKKNAFPTIGDSWVVDHDGDLKAEQPLLIDPTGTDPEPLFEWSFEGSIATIVAKDGEPRAARTIEVLGLNRRFLTEERYQLLDQLRLLGQQVRDWLQEFEDAGSDVEAGMAIRGVNRALAAIANLGLPGKPHAALARAYLARTQAFVRTMLG